MKKHLIALAVAGAVAAPAMAQNASIYGQIAVTANQTSTDSADTSSVNADKFGTSMIGIKGQEDLGGGLKALFQMEGDNETSSTSFAFNRHLFVGLSGGFGTIKVGRTSTALDSLDSYTAQGLNIFDTASTALQTKPDGIVRFESAKIAGLSAVATVVNQNDGTAENNEGETALSVAGNVMGLDFAVGYGSQNANDASTTIFNVGYKLSFGDVRGQIMSNDSAGTSSDYTSIGFAAPLGNGLTATVHWQSYDTAGSNSDYKQIGAALSKALSKRTSAHIGMTSKSLDGTGADTEFMAIGLQHSF